MLLPAKRTRLLYALNRFKKTRPQRAATAATTQLEYKSMPPRLPQPQQTITDTKPDAPTIADVMQMIAFAEVEKMGVEMVGWN